ncbi:MAG: riboflavin kinase [bacterium]|nr:riboflavin kinase [bacterium]
MQFTGRVIVGEKKGTALGYPTANLKAHPELDYGVYAVKVEHLGEKLPGVLCFGVLDKNNEPKCEVHIFDYVGDLYGRDLTVEVVGDRINGIEKLVGDEAHRSKIVKDINKAKELLQ